MDIAAFLSTLTSAKQIVEVLIAERDHQKNSELKAELLSKIVSAQIQMSEIMAGVLEKDKLIQTLSECNRELEADKAQRNRYELAKIGSIGEFFAYKLRSPDELDTDKGETSHYLCQPCFDDGKKSVLSHNGDGYWLCRVCKQGQQVEPIQSVYTDNVTNKGGGWY